MALECAGAGRPYGRGVVLLSGAKQGPQGASSRFLPCFLEAVYPSLGQRQPEGEGGRRCMEACCRAEPVPGYDSSQQPQMHPIGGTRRRAATRCPCHGTHARFAAAGSGHGSSGQSSQAALCIVAVKLCPALCGLCCCPPAPTTFPLLQQQQQQRPAASSGCSLEPQWWTDNPFTHIHGCARLCHALLCAGAAVPDFDLGSPLGLTC